MKYKELKPLLCDKEWELNWFEGCVSFMPEYYEAKSNNDNDLIMFGEYEVKGILTYPSGLKILLEK